VTDKKRRNKKTRIRKVQAVLRDIKMSRGCIDCGYKANHFALHFDHREPPTKSFGLDAAWNYSWERIMAEVDKCDVRCANCHAVRTHTR